MRKYWIIWVLIPVCLIGCRPRGILSSREMRSVLVDLHKTDALLQVSGLQHGHNDAEDAYYAAVLAKHGISQAEFDSSLVWYTRHPQLFDKIYPHVLQQLEAEKEQFDAEHGSEIGPQSSREQHLRMREKSKPVEQIYWEMRNGPALPYWNRYPEPAEPVEIPLALKSEEDEEE